MTITVRKIAAPDFAEEITALHRGCFSETSGEGTPALDKGQWWAAFHVEHGLAGFALLTATRERGVYYLKRAAVDRRFRGQGLQKRFIRARVRYAIEQGGEVVVTDTYENPASSNSLISCGFRLYTPAVGWSFKHALYWRKEL